ncbi:tRNA-dependent cyclodipeptide synthase [Synechococcus sp. ATX 2A4]|uniref:tRNA-dependent cyclodipeptide synthase n=1 Tax=Synechococcus sp. ATX 2A4 TaxID=2823727 RepID=UPI0020CEF0EC|nr:tRNA-dependent cyclodipeptide synthase [Synechococcus sp. ATX 2A4]MCP9884131.1 tRNA-dependent cyclodipeptide synthase [Synechococcus sp. ATX 2A4]
MAAVIIYGDLCMIPPHKDAEHGSVLMSKIQETSHQLDSSISRIMETSFLAELICPQCGIQISKSIGLSACIVRHTCPRCSFVIRPRPGEGCIFSSYGSVGYPLNTFNPTRCLPQHGERVHVVVGTSPFNSYYSESRLTALLLWAYEHFEQVGVFIPDTPTVWTLEAGGYTPEQASYKTKRQLRYHSNKIGRAREAVDAVTRRIGLLPWSSVAQYGSYAAAEVRCRAAFAADSEFRRECLAA